MKYDYQSDGTVILQLGYVNEFGDPVERTKHTHPYSYDGFVVHINGNNEDARTTFNQVKDMVGEDIAEIIYQCTELRGRNRAQRKSVDFYLELNKNRLAVFVKLCDLIANVKFSLLTNSNMLSKYRDEYPKVKGALYADDYKDMFDYLETIV